MFVDEVKIKLIAGDGGDGCLAFRREKYIPMGGPYGGNGGRGGNIIFETDEGLKTLIDLRYQKIIKGKKGANGEGKNKNGKNASDIIIKVPVGTTLVDEDTGYIIADLVKNKEEVIVATGGRGGLGNVSLATKNNPCPNYAEKGELGEVRCITASLRMLADVGLVGLPSVGKSTILSMISNANPKIAGYHFTTLSPNLGVVKTNSDFSFVVADLPGLIEGASEGAGLGIKFLKHVERTKIIAHVIDMSESEGRDAYQDYLTINKELEAFNPKLLLKPTIIIANKMDLENSKENLKKFKEKVKNIDIFEVQAQNNIGLDNVINHLSNLVKDTKSEALFEEDRFEGHVLYKFKKTEPFTIKRENNTYIVSGEQVEKLLRMTNFRTEDAMIRFAQKLRKMGIDNRLEELGIQEGDYVRILDYEFEYKKD